MKELPSETCGLHPGGLYIHYRPHRSGSWWTWELYSIHLAFTSYSPTKYVLDAIGMLNGRRLTPTHVNTLVGLRPDTPVYVLMDYLKDYDYLPIDASYDGDDS